MLAGDALCWSPRVLTGQHRNLCGILPDVETGQEFSSVAARKSFHFIENRQSLAQITQQKINQKWHQGVSTVLRQRSAPSIKWSLMLSIRTWMVGRGCGGRSRSAVRCLWSASGTPPPHMDSQIDNTCSKDNTLGRHKDTQSSGKSNRTLVHCPTGREVLILLSEKRGN